MNSHFGSFLSETRSVWITGASSGIGRDMAIQLAQAGHRVVISARDNNALQALAQQYPQNLLPLPLDITDKEAMCAAAAVLAELAPQLDIAILNAGTCEYLDETGIDLALVERVMTVNFNGSLYAAEMARPLLECSRNAMLYVVSSQVTSLPLTRSGAYGASKAAIEYFFRCLRIDWYNKNIFIGIIRPGFVKTPLTDRNDFSMPWLWTAEEAARKILLAIDRRKAEVTFPFALHAVLTSLGKLPYTWWATIAQSMRKTKEGSQP